ncbi:esterase-like activity of phytase family protein [Aquimarina intermedia]|uniref:Phytase-like domain-containing protein n=1 Tax=Aquimarina intermedia TaxID=350814 RepID=A0A5S5BYX5_9FLAO|nr:esterase-like activity of phytase family protein [Aquimarina intermedia]TYP72244.1 hypothetical protein BD809_107129 [Aquimarina intermedia]
MHQNLVILIRYLVLLGLVLALSKCNTIRTAEQKKVSINFLDEFVIENDSLFTKNKIGGLSGLDYNPILDSYVFISDDPISPHYYTASINIANKQIQNVRFDSIIYLKNLSDSFLDKQHFDLEGIRFYSTDKIIISSEGSIKHNKDPFIYTQNIAGDFNDHYILPSYFKPSSNSDNLPRHNGTLEAITLSKDKKGLWTAMELPLVNDGEEPSYASNGAPVRFTYFNNKTKQATRQFVYSLDKLAKDPKAEFGVNGVTDILQLTADSFLVLERSYSVGYGRHGNTVRLYLAPIKNTTNTLDFVSLKNNTFKVAKKTLLFDFESVMSKLTDQSIDNIEGITFGPKLENGNQTLLLISDNNFNPRSIQKNQLIALELLLEK